MGSHAGAYVVDLGTGQVLYARNAERALAPASNEKLYTSITALQRLGPDARLTTTVSGRIRRAGAWDGDLDGNLNLVGGGDRPSHNDFDARAYVGPACPSSPSNSS